MNSLSYDRLRSTLERTVRLSLEEDLGRGDITTDACVPEGTRGAAAFGTRQEVVVAGIEVVREVFRQVDSTVTFSDVAADGSVLAPGGLLARVRGDAGSILRAERVALNFAQRLCGVATLTRRYVSQLAPGSKTRVVDTRKTTPGLRGLERHAVRCGGGHNHREDLSAGVLIKDNHIAAAGGVREAVENARRRAPHTTRIECEVDTLEQMTVALDAGADILLLDNFDDAMVAKAIELNAGRAMLEASGGITVDRIAALSALGVDLISVGALTHSAPSVDVGLDWENP